MAWSASETTGLDTAESVRTNKANLTKRAKSSDRDCTWTETG